MNKKDFMNQTAVDMTVRELLEAIRIKAKQSKTFSGEMIKAMRNIEYRNLAKEKKIIYGKSPLQHPEILQIVQQLVQMDKNFAKIQKDNLHIKLVKEEK